MQTLELCKIVGGRQPMADRVPPAGQSVQLT
jgi:hypothetical protein